MPKRGQRGGGNERWREVAVQQLLAPLQPHRVQTRQYTVPHLNIDHDFNLRDLEQLLDQVGMMEQMHGCLIIVCGSGAPDRVYLLHVGEVTHVKHLTRVLWTVEPICWMLVLQC